jgi:hypothetical protein
VADREQVIQAVRAQAATAASAAFTFAGGHLVVTSAVGQTPVPAVRDTAANRAALEVHRDLELPDDMPWLMLNIRTATPSLEEETVGVRRFFWTIEPRLWLAVAHPDEAIRRLVVEAMIDQVETALETDRTLGGAADTTWLQPPEDMEETGELGYENTYIAALPYLVYYQTARSSG